MTSKDVTKQPDPVSQSAPDPEEDDLDELDDILDQFSNAKADPPPSTSRSEGEISGAKNAPSGSETGQTAEPVVTDTSDDANEKEFEKQMRVGMAEMLRQLEEDPALAKQFEDMMTNLGAPLPSDLGEAQSQGSDGTAMAQGSSPSRDLPGTTSSTDAAFQDTIQKTMDRMRQSAASANAASQPKPSGSSGNATEDDMMSALLSELSGLGGADSGGDESFSQLLLSMMEQLTNKEILYEPMKELNSKFPAWLDERKPGGAKEAELQEEDRKRFEEQQKLVQEIVECFEKPGYSDENPPDREYIVERMQKMQAAGAPPSELVGDMAGAEAMLGGMDENCATQ